MLELATGRRELHRSYIIVAHRRTLPPSRAFCMERNGAQPVDWTALPPLALLRLLRAGCDGEDLAPPGVADYVAATGAASLPFGLLLCAVCRSWRAALRDTEPLWRNLLCARACRSLWGSGQPPAVAPAALLRHRLTLRLAHAAGLFISLTRPHAVYGSRLRKELKGLLVGDHLPCPSVGRRAEADGAPTLLRVRTSASGEPTFTFAVLGTHDSAFGGAWLRVHVTPTERYPFSVPEMTVEPRLPFGPCAWLGTGHSFENPFSFVDWSPSCFMLSLVQICVTVATERQFSDAEGAGARQLAAAALAGGSSSDDEAYESAGEDDGGEGVLRVTLPPGRALLRMALYTGVALDSRGRMEHIVPRSCRVRQWDAFVEEAWRREAARRARLARVLRWTAALAGAPCPPLAAALEAELDAAAAAGAAPPSFRPHRGVFDASPAAGPAAGDHSVGVGDPDAEEKDWLRAQPAASVEPLWAILTDEAADARLQRLLPDERRLVMEKLRVPSWERKQRAPLHHLVLPMRRLALHQLCQLRLPSAQADAAAAADLALVELLHEAEASGGSGTVPEGTAQALLASWQQACSGGAGAAPTRSLHAWLGLRPPP